MNIPHLSSQTLSCIVIAMVGLVGLLSVVVSNEMRNTQITENYQKSFLGFLRMESDDLIESLGKLSSDLGLALQHETKFREALYRNNQPGLVKLLNNQFHQYFVTARVLQLEKIKVLSTTYDTLAESTEGPSLFSSKHLCPELVSRASIRNGAERLKVIGEICMVNERPFHVVLVPIGGLRLHGYLQIVTNPTLTLRAIQKNLSLPLRITTRDNRNLYLSKNWLEHRADENYLITTYMLKTSTGEAAMRISVQHDAAALTATTNTTRMHIYLVAGFFTIISVFFATQVLRRTNLRPLTHINETLTQWLAEDEIVTHKITPTGHKEAFELSQHINAIIALLRTKNDTDPLTNVANRDYFLTQLKHVTENKTPPTINYALVIIRLDSLSLINQTAGYEAGDSALKQTAKRLSAVLDNERKTTLTDATAANCLTARISGNRFAALLQYSSEDKTRKVIQKIISIMDEPFNFSDNPLASEIHIGMAITQQHGTQMDQLLQQAEIALSQARQKKTTFIFV